MNNITKMTELLEQYDDYLDESGEFTVGGCAFRPSYILKELDPTAYRCGYLDYADSMGIDIDDLEE